MSIKLQLKNRFFSGENKISPEKNLILIEEVMNEMRKDSSVKQVDKGNLMSIFINDVEQILKKQV